MQQIFTFLIIATTVCIGQAKVHLKKEVNLTVGFEGETLIIEVENPQNENKAVKLCFGSSAGTTNEFCPDGYAAAVFAVTANKKAITLNRRGELLPKDGLGTFGNVRFEDDGTVRILVANMPAGAVITLPNAEIPVITTTTTTLAPNNGTSHKATVLILFVTILIIVVVIVGITVWYCCFCRRKKNQTVAVPEEQLPSKLNRTGHPVDNKKAGARKQPSVIKTTRTSTSTAKANEEKLRVNSVPKPPQNTPIASSIYCISIRPATAQESISDSQIL